MNEKKNVEAFPISKVLKNLESQFSINSPRVNRIGFHAEYNSLYLEVGSRYFVLNRRSLELTEAEKPRHLHNDIRLYKRKIRSLDGARTSVTVDNQLDSPVKIDWVDRQGKIVTYGQIDQRKSFETETWQGHVWRISNEAGDRIGFFETRIDDHIVLDQDSTSNVQSGQPASEFRRNRTKSRRDRFTGEQNVKYEKPAWNVRVKDHNLWLIPASGNSKKIKLTSDGTRENSFASERNLDSSQESRPQNVRWSPSAKHCIAFQSKRSPTRIVNFVESTPKDQLQPRLHTLRYAKPGDEIPIARVRLFSAESRKEIPVSNELFDNPYSLRFLDWSESGDRFWMFYNQRGHQVLRLLEVDAKTGNVRSLIEEKSSTFLHYSNPAKSFHQNLPNNQILWASERSGWNHIYRFDRESGKLINPVTQGNWNVKRIDNVDTEQQTIWFYAVGVVPGQDPYHEHFCRVDFDGQNFRCLTEGDGTHQVRFTEDRKHLVDSWSRIDHAPVTELRSSETGKVIVELDRKDTQKEFGERRLTTRFMAKGRDGKTDIWGIIHWPRNFDSDSSYPVIENIYAGPHDHHVPKSFRKNFRHQHQIADQGFIVVQIDGMGTAWRSKAFHDVCHKNLKDAGFPDRIKWIKAAAKKHPQMDISRVGIYGGSAGGQNAMAALLWHNDFYSVAVADCGCHDNRMDKIWWNEQWMGWPVESHYAENSNAENAHLLEGNLMLTLGELDRNVDPASTVQVVKKLIEADKDFEFVLIAGGGHGAGETPWAARKRMNFFKQHLQEK